jgi:protoheme IX farnesyltransferase
MSSASQPLAVPRAGIASLVHDYATLTKARVTTLIVMTAWAGAYFAAAKSGVSSLSWTLLHALIGIGLVSGGTAAINEVVERDIDALMRRTSQRPLVTGSMSLPHASVIAFGMTIGGVAYLWLTTNWLTAALAALTSVS